MIYIGIDPGADGCAAVYRPDYETTLVFITLESILELEGFGPEAEPPTMVMLEKPAGGFVREGALRHSTKQSAYRMGYNVAWKLSESYWKWWMLFRKFPMETPTPRSWKSAMLKGCGIKDTKAASIKVAQQLFPGVDFRRTLKCKKPDHNRCEAALLAVYAQRRSEGHA